MQHVAAVDVGDIEACKERSAQPPHLRRLVDNERDASVQDPMSVIFYTRVVKAQLSYFFKSKFAILFTRPVHYLYNGHHFCLHLCVF